MSWEIMTESYSCDLFSHPGKKLRDHLSAVADYCEDTHNAANPDFSSLGYSKELLSIFSRTLGICHDFGKATTYFQDYLFSDEKNRLKLKMKPETHHGLISAIFTYHCLRETLKTRADANNSLLPFIGYVLVRHHHGDLKNFFEETSDIRNPEKLDIMKRQCESISGDTLRSVYYGLISEDIITAFFRDMAQDKIISSIVQNGNRFRLIPRLEQIPEAPAMEVLTLFYYSLLLSGDKQDAAEISANRIKGGLRSDLVDRYREMKEFSNASSPINQLRNEIYDEVVSNVRTLDLNKKIYSLNVPTGTGKTLTSVSFALKLRERLNLETGCNPQILYCLPFLSIIDQNYDVISSVFSSPTCDPVPSNILLKHHHLADLSYTSTDDGDYEEDESRLLIEGWHSEFIITTFVQFFHTILSNRNRAIRKYHTLANAIVILDEVQSIPHEYWLLFHDVIVTLTRCLNMRVIFVTATQPLIFDEAKTGEIFELATKKKMYFSQLNRVNLFFNPQPYDLQQFIENIQLRIHNEQEKDFLIVLNTINAAKEVYTSLSSLNEPETEFVFLSTHIIPKERLARIRNIRNPDIRKRKVIVSTQLIEAGVDIDVDVVYRDMAPLDSINQVAGRCNRNNQQDAPGEVQIVTLQADEKNYCNYIYSQFLLDKTRIILEGKGIISEQQFLTLNNQYFRLVEELHTNDTANKCLDLIRYLKYSDLQNSFHLIQNDYPKMDIFVECDDDARKLWQKFVEIKSKPYAERKNEFLKIKKEFLDHVISVPKNKAQGLFREDLGIGHISQEELAFRYDIRTGFKPCDGGTVII
jgi:CRISPR-associated endonuclease/helicase Cas3